MKLKQITVAELQVGQILVTGYEIYLFFNKVESIDRKRRLIYLKGISRGFLYKPRRDICFILEPEHWHTIC